MASVSLLLLLYFSGLMSDLAGLLTAAATYQPFIGPVASILNVAWQHYEGMRNNKEGVRELLVRCDRLATHSAKTIVNNRDASRGMKAIVDNLIRSVLSYLKIAFKTLGRHSCPEEILIKIFDRGLQDIAKLVRKLHNKGFWWRARNRSKIAGKISTANIAISDLFQMFNVSVTLPLNMSHNRPLYHPTSTTLTCGRCVRLTGTFVLQTQHDALIDISAGQMQIKTDLDHLSSVRPKRFFSCAPCRVVLTVGCRRSPLSARTSAPFHLGHTKMMITLVFHLGHTKLTIILAPLLKLMLPLPLLPLLLRRWIHPFLLGPLLCRWSYMIGGWSIMGQRQLTETSRHPLHREPRND